MTHAVLRCSMLVFRHGVSRYFVSKSPWNAFPSMRVEFLWMFIVMSHIYPQNQYCIHLMPLNTSECSLMDVLNFLIKGQMWYFNEVYGLANHFPFQSDTSFETSYDPLESLHTRHPIFAFLLFFLLYLHITIGSIFLASSSPSISLCCYWALPALPTMLSQFFRLPVLIQNCSRAIHYWRVLDCSVMFSRWRSCLSKVM